MRTTVQMWGNSLALRIPKALADQAGLSQGSLVDVKIVDEVLQVKPLAPARYTLDALLGSVSEENIHYEIDTGEARGKEVW